MLNDHPIIRGYEFVERLARGGRSEVLRYRQEMLQRDVAVKVGRHPLSTPEKVRFLRLAEVMGRMDSHPNFVTIYDAGFTPEDCGYLIMECALGPTAAELVKDTPLDLESALRVTIEIASALAVLHHQGVTHGDIKPSNILTNHYGMAMLSDLDVALLAGESSTSDDFGFTPLWVDPQVIALGVEPSPRSDIYSLTATLWGLLTGDSPHRWNGRQTPLRFAVPEVSPEELTRISRDLARLIMTNAQGRDRAQYGSSPETANPALPLLTDHITEIIFGRLRPASAVQFIERLQLAQTELGFPKSRAVVDDVRSIGGVDSGSGRELSVAEMLEDTIDSATFSAGLRLWPASGVDGRHSRPEEAEALGVERGDTAPRPPVPDARPASDAEDALNQFIALVNERTRTLGADHRDTLLARGEVAMWIGRAGDAKGAARLFAALVDDRTRVLGADHPDTLLARSNLATWTGRAGDINGAARLFAALVDDRTRVLGPSHPDTLLARRNRESWIRRSSGHQR